MPIQIDKLGKKKVTNNIFLIQKVADINPKALSKKSLKHVESRLKDLKTTIFNEEGVFTIVIPFKEINKKTNAGFVNREKLRAEGHRVFNQLKKEVKEVLVEGSSAQACTAFLEGLILSAYEFDKYKKTKNSDLLKRVFVANNKVDIERLQINTDATHWARYLVDEPQSFLNASELSNQIKKKCEPVGINVEVFSKQKIESLKMGGLLAVNKGSIQPPTFNILEWKPKKTKNKKPIVLVGKGVVYDTGGLSLKSTANSMDLMKSDMGGAAAMAATIYGIAKLKLPLHVIALIPATDNRPGLDAYAPGDVITMFDKTTVEVLNTDAEGRMILADALAYSNKLNPELVIDAATLTGAAVRAIGTFASCVMGNADQNIINELSEAGFETHDRVVQLPFWDDYAEEMKSPIADLKNLGGPYAGMITAGKFLENFVKSPYIHIDIAGPAFTTKQDSYRGKGGTGAGVRLLIEFLTKKAK